MADRGEKKKGREEGGEPQWCTFFAADLLALSLSLSLCVSLLSLPLFLVQSLPKVITREKCGLILALPSRCARNDAARATMQF